MDAAGVQPAFLELHGASLNHVSVSSLIYLACILPWECEYSVDKETIKNLYVTVVAACTANEKACNRPFLQNTILLRTDTELGDPSLVFSP